MPKDIDDLYKKLDQHSKSSQKDSDQLTRAIDVVGKDNLKIAKEINNIKQQIKDIDTKIDIILEVMNNFTIMLAEDIEDDEMEEEYDFDTDESWVPKEENFWEDDDSDE
jgi:septal ring factor EnvC (AmiA/AmiB activator)